MEKPMHLVIMGVSGSGKTTIANALSERLGWTYQTLGAGPLLLIAAGAIAVLLVLIIKLRVHAFVALILVSLLTAFATGIPASQVVPAPSR